MADVKLLSPCCCLKDRALAAMRRGWKRVHCCVFSGGCAGLRLKVRELAARITSHRLQVGSRCMGHAPYRVKLILTLVVLLAVALVVLRLLGQQDVGIQNGWLLDRDGSADPSLESLNKIPTPDPIVGDGVKMTTSGQPDDVITDQKIADGTTHARDDFSTERGHVTKAGDDEQEVTNGESTQSDVTVGTPTTKPRDFGHALNMTKSASSDDVIILVVVTLSYLEQASNFYVTSVLPHGLTNVLFIGLDDEICERLTSLSHVMPIHCYTYRIDAKSKVHVPFGSRSFNRIANVKSRAALKAITLGYNVLVTDVDVIYLKNPLSYLRDTCNRTNCDLLTQYHDPGYNSGFVYARCTRNAAKIYQEALIVASANRRLTDQSALNAAIRKVSFRRNIRLRTLDTRQFPVGKHFFVGMFCPPKERYDQVMVVHNNWISGSEPKIMRAKECLFWHYDGTNAYYSSDRRKYLILARPLPHSRLPEGILNLFAFAAVLHRTPILPRFYVQSRKVSYPVWPLIRAVAGLQNFNNATRRLGYRESSFLRNPLVPQKVKDSQSSVYSVVASDTVRSLPDRLRLELADPKVGPTADTIRNWFRDERRSVIRIDPILTKFTNLYYSKLIGQQLVGMIVRLSRAKSV